MINKFIFNITRILIIILFSIFSSQHELNRRIGKNVYVNNYAEISNIFQYFNCYTILLSEFHFKTENIDEIYNHEPKVDISEKSSVKKCLNKNIYIYVLLLLCIIYFPRIKLTLTFQI
jgi:hypothetical protein